ncbi:formylglycine-generating enzyme family protein [Pendulispora albinea]|uniref:Formylglycine-generating enzyme family protein n=1 Tax=Pendulispora albinea TaxID=2741071 RepID=A0ABZ2LUU2_9BACT
MSEPAPPTEPARRGLHMALGAAIIALVTAAVVLRKTGSHVECGPGFVARAPRCLGCPAPLIASAGGCDAPDVRVEVPATTFTLGPSDWEAQGRVAPRLVHVAPFAIDAYEATVAKVERRPSPDGARAASNLTRDEAAAYCASRGGRLPTEDEWMAAAAGDRPRRYPWGDTGAVCRRAAWGLDRGPCAHGALGPDTVGAHPDGDTPTGIHDLAGNVAEWVASDASGGPNSPAGGAFGVARGGSYRTELATELRTWSRMEIPPSSRNLEVGVRCAYEGSSGAAIPGYPRRSP